MKLNELKTFESAEILEVNIESGKIAQRLADLGLKKGHQVTCLIKSPMGGVTSYQLSLGIFAIEDTIADQVFVERI